MIKETKSEKTSSWIDKHNKKIILILTVLLVALAVLTFFGLNLQEQDEPIPKIESKIKGEFLTRIDLGYLEYFRPATAETLVKVEGVVPNPGWVTISVSNFTYHEDFDQPKIVVYDVYIDENIEFSVDEGNFIEEFPLTLRFDWRYPLEYPPKDPTWRVSGPIGNILMKIEYLDSTTNSTEIFYFNPFITGDYLIAK